MSYKTLKKYHYVTLKSLEFMPFPLVPLIIAAAGVANSIIASRAAKKQTRASNEANLELAKYSYGEQQKQIDKQNLYNSPAAQMARYREAGLSPNLIYGQGSSGNQSSTPAFNPPQMNMRHAVFQIPDMISQYQDFQMRNAQIEKVRTSTELDAEKIRLNAVQTMLGAITGKRKSFDLEQAKILAPYQQDIKHGQAQSAYTKVLQEYARLSSMNQDVVNKRIQERLMQQNITRNDLDNTFKKYRNEWMRQGVTTSDSLPVRLITLMLKQAGVDFTGTAGALLKGGKEGWDSRSRNFTPLH